MDLLESPNAIGLLGCLLNCSGKGQCKPEGTSESKCVCLDNFKGDKCDVDLRPCKYRPCLNQGECEDVMDTSLNYYDFKCKCKGSSTGKFCQNKIDICFNETCSSNGYCQDNNGVPECKCKYLYQGNKCEIESAELQTKKAVQKEAI